MFRLLFLTSPLVFSFPRIVVGCVLFLFRSGGYCQSSVFIQIFSICKFSLTPFLFLFFPLFFRGPAPGVFLFYRRKISRMSFSAAGKCKVQLPHGIFPQSFFHKRWRWISIEMHTARVDRIVFMFLVPGSFGRQCRRRFG
jgi:hypothetical protein